MSEYPKTDNLFARDEQTHKLIVGEFRRPDFAQVNRWLVTEKIDGTNIRLILSPDGTADVRGRSDNATLPKRFLEEAFSITDAAELAAPLRAALAAINDPDKLDRLGMIVYGEGYGPGIQKGGGNYAGAKSFRAFDVATFRLVDTAVDGEVVRVPGHRLWRTWADVETVAAALGVKTAPMVGGNWTTDDVVAYVGGKHHAARKVSWVATEEGDPSAIVPEGVIARTDPYLFTFRGERVVFKLKCHDLPAPTEQPTNSAFGNPSDAQVTALLG